MGNIFSVAYFFIQRLMIASIIDLSGLWEIIIIFNKIIANVIHIAAKPDSKKMVIKSKSKIWSRFCSLEIRLHYILNQTRKHNKDNISNCCKNLSTFKDLQ